MSGQAWFDEADHEVKPKKKTKQRLASSNSATQKKGILKASSKTEVSSDKHLKEQIWKDVQRTYPGLHFFTEKTCEILQRILFIYAKSYKEIGYVQGMNEVLAPLAYVCQVTQGVDREAICFYLFERIMDTLGDVYKQGKGTNELNFSKPILRKMNAFKWLLYRHDIVLFKKLHNLTIEPWFYLFRWLTTLLSREFYLPDTLRLWDTIFSEYLELDSKFDFILYVSCAILISLKQTLLESDFENAMKTLQAYPITTLDMKNLLQLAVRIYEKDKKFGVNIKLLKDTPFSMKSKKNRKEDEVISQGIEDFKNMVNKIDMKQISESVKGWFG